MNEFWESSIKKGYYDIVLSEGLKKRRSIQSNWHHISFSRISSKISNQKTHLDYACGPGSLIGRYTNLDSTGVDISKNQIDYAKDNFSSKGIFMTIEDYKKKDYLKNFDVITIMGLFEFLSDDEIVNLLDNLYEDLESGGKLYSTTLNFQTPLKTVLFFQKKFSENDYSDEHVNIFNKEKLLTILNKTKFSNIKINKFMTFGVFFSFLSNNFGFRLNKFIEGIFFRKYGFLLLIELTK